MYSTVTVLGSTEAHGQTLCGRGREELYIWVRRQQEERERLCLTWAFETSKATPSDILSPTIPQALILSNSATRYVCIGAMFIQTTICSQRPERGAYLCPAYFLPFTRYTIPTQEMIPFTVERLPTSINVTKIIPPKDMARVCQLSTFALQVGSWNKASQKQTRQLRKAKGQFNYLNNFFQAKDIMSWEHSAWSFLMSELQGCVPLLVPPTMLGRLPAHRNKSSLVTHYIETTFVFLSLQT